MARRFWGSKLQQSAFWQHSIVIDFLDINLHMSHVAEVNFFFAPRREHRGIRGSRSALHVLSLHESVREGERER